MEDKITKKQLQLVHIGKSALGLSDEQYRLMLSDFWVQSSKDLSLKEASQLLDKMKQMGFKIIKKRKTRNMPTDITQLPSRAILKKIDLLKADIRWRVMPNGYSLWLKKFLNIERPRTMNEAIKIVQALKSMLYRQENNAD